MWRFFIEFSGMAVNLSLWVWAGLAVLAAWSVGAYSRLQRLRQSAEQARSFLRKHLLRCSELVDSIDNGAAAPGLTSLRQVSELAEHWGRDPKCVEVPAGLGEAIDCIELTLAQLRQQPEDLAGAVLPVELVTAWVTLEADIAARRMRYNVHVAELNEALLQMPARVLAHSIGMRTWEYL